MRYLVNGREMKEIDRRTIEDYGIPSLVLMERAAFCVAQEAEQILKERSSDGSLKGYVWAVCGMGNNGADGVAAARMLKTSRSDRCDPSDPDRTNESGADHAA